MSVRSRLGRIGDAVRVLRGRSVDGLRGPGAGPAPLEPLVRAAVRARPPAPPVPLHALEARRRHASQMVFGIAAVTAVVPAATVPRDRPVDPWWTPALPPRHAEETPEEGATIVDEQRYPVRTLEGEARELRRTVLRGADGRRRKTYELFHDGAAVRAWASDSLALFAAERLPAEAARVVVTEGAPAADRLLKAEVVAVGTLTGALRLPPDAALEPLRRVPDVVLWPDNDEVGVRHMEQLAARLRASGVARVRMVRWVGGPFHGDAADVADAAAARALVDAAEELVPGRVVLSTVRQAPRPAVRVPYGLELSDEPPTPVPSAAAEPAGPDDAGDPR